MDSRLVNQNAALWADRTLRLTPALFIQLGLVKKSIQLKVEEFSISCIPFDLSLTKASLLAFLSEKEIEFFKKFVTKPQKLSLTRISPYTGKPEVFFIVSRISAFRKNEGNSPYCFIDVVFQEPSLAFKEVLVGYFVESDEADRFFQAAPDSPLSAEQISAALGSLHLSLLKEACAGERLKILYLSPKRIRLFGELEGTLPAVGEVVELEPFEGDANCLMKGSCTELAPLADAPGFAYLGVQLEFSAYTSARIRRAVSGETKASSS